MEEGWRGRKNVFWTFALLHMSRRAHRGRRIAGTIVGTEQAAWSEAAAGTWCNDNASSPRYFGRRVAPRLIRLLRDLFRSVKPRRAWIQFKIGMDDPADLGRLWAAISRCASR